MESIKNCPICSSSNLVEFLSCKDQTVSHETFQIVKCESCELLITSPRPEEKLLGNYYLSEDYISHTGKSTNIIDKLYLLARTFTLRWKTRIVRNISTHRNSILDYGCGTGEFLHACQKKGWKITGVEPSPIARKQAAELTSTSIHKELHEIKEKTFDTITLWHVLEHVAELETVLASLKSKLNTTGTLFIAVPNYKSWDSEQYKNYWAAYDVPRHLWHFSYKNIALLLKKNSLTLVDTIPMKLDAYYISLLSEKYKTGKKITLLTILKAISTATVSNLKAKRTKEYSSRIYIAKHDIS